MRILWNSNAPWAPSGYGEQTALFVPRLKALGHEVSCLANYGLQAAQAPWGGITVYPGDGHWNNTIVGTVADHCQAEVVITLADAWVMNPDAWPPHLKMGLWAPIDHWPIPPKVLATLQHPKVRPIAMSHDGFEWMERFDLDPLYVPHGVDTSLFYPQPDLRSVIRKELGIPVDAFVLGMVAANKGNPSIPRKSFPQVFEAFTRFAKRHEDAYLYVHTDARGAGGGLALDTLALALGAPEGRLRFPPIEAIQLGMQKDLVARIYQALDVLVNPSMGEGFGIPILEAQACGVPVIASNHSAMKELTQAGWLVAGDNWWDALQESFLYMPHVGSIEQAMEMAYETRKDEPLRERAVEFAQAYDADLVTARDWVPALQQLAQATEIGPLTSNRAARRRAKRAQEKARA